MMVMGFVITGAVSSLLKGTYHLTRVSWHPVAVIVVIVFTGTFVLFFGWNLISAMRAQPVYEILEEETPESELLAEPLQGFVGMEYYWGILNRTFVVFIAPERLYGWKASGPVTNANRTYYEPFLEMFKDPDLMRNRVAIERLAKLRGGFAYDRLSIATVDADDRRKWGMGGIPHAGRIHIRLNSGRKQEFILLGDQIPEEVRDSIVRRMGIGVTSVV